MLLPFRVGVGGPMGSGKQIMSWIHLDDMINILMLLLQKDSFQGPYNTTAPVPVSNQGILKNSQSSPGQTGHVESV